MLWKNFNAKEKKRFLCRTGMQMLFPVMADLILSLTCRDFFKIGKYPIHLRDVGINSHM